MQHSLIRWTRREERERKRRIDPVPNGGKREVVIILQSRVEHGRVGLDLGLTSPPQFDFNI